MQSTDIITAAPSRMAKAFWGRYFERSIRRSFHRVYLKGEDQLLPWTPRAPRRMTEPIILYATHGSWWDAAMAMVLSLRTYQLDAYGMMEYKQLSRYAFFRRIGLFSVVREDPRSAITSLRYAASVLQGTGRALWMFPQGTLVHQDARPLDLEPGLGILSKSVTPVWLCPVAFRYEMLREQHPNAWIQVGTPYRYVGGSGTILEVTLDAEVRLAALADEVRSAAVIENLDGFTEMLRGRRSMEKQFDKVRGR